MERILLHFDGDSFFASIEQAMDYRLRGKPIVTGAERGAATALSIEAKRLGLYRGMPMKEIRERCPDIVVVNSNYIAYSLYARRMYAIVRRYTPLVEEYSIDECFADITELEQSYNKSYEEIALMIKRDLEASLGITFGVGMGPSKVIAKIGSKYNKPAGFTPISRERIPEFLEKLPIGSVWGIGRAMTIKLQGLGILTALQFAQKEEAWLREHNIAKPYREIWYELRGGYTKPLVLEPDQIPGSIIKTRTFAPPSKDKAFVFSQLSKNIERACAKARGVGASAREVGVMLKSQGFLYRNREVPLALPTNDPVIILSALRGVFEEMFVPNILYRATGVSLRGLVSESAQPQDLFGASAQASDGAAVLSAVDKLNRRYGSQTVHLASSLKAVQHREPDRQKKRKVIRVQLSVEQRKKTIDLPFLGRVH